jgi:hypothetical protein
MPRFVIIVVVGKSDAAAIWLPPTPPEADRIARVPLEKLKESFEKTKSPTCGSLHFEQCFGRNVRQHFISIPTCPYCGLFYT